MLNLHLVWPMIPHNHTLKLNVTPEQSSYHHEKCLCSLDKPWQDTQKFLVASAKCCIPFKGVDVQDLLRRWYVPQQNSCLS